MKKCYDNKLWPDLQAFFDTLEPEVDLVELPAGHYQQRLVVRRSRLTIRGCGEVWLVGTACVGTMEKTGLTTYQTATLYLLGNQLQVENLKIANQAGCSQAVGQAVAVYIEGDEVSLQDCQLQGNQDTLYLGRPQEMVPTKTNRHYFNNCQILGDIDFIFGSAAALFYRCTLINTAPAGQSGFYTAAATPQDQPVGFVFYQCCLQGNSAAILYLGRPWREYAKTSFLACQLACRLAEGHWDDWQKPAARGTVVYCEAENTYAHDSQPVSWISRQADQQQLFAYFGKEFDDDTGTMVSKNGAFNHGANAETL